MTLPGCVLWDWNGTLIDDAPLAWGILCSMAEARGVAPVSFERYRQIYGHPVQGIYERAGFDLVREPFDVLSHEWHTSYQEGLKGVPLQPDALRTLGLFRDLGLVQAIVSALPHDILIIGVESLGVRSFFAEVCGLTDRLARSKIENARAVLERLGEDPHHTILIGDSAHDGEVAQALGTRCVLVARGYESRDRLEGYGWPVCSDFAELVAFLEVEAASG